MTALTVVLEGGCVVAAFSDDPEIDFNIIDLDEGEEAQRQIDETSTALRQVY